MKFWGRGSFKFLVSGVTQHAGLERGRSLKVAGSGSPALLLVRMCWRFQQGAGKILPNFLGKNENI
jgi:hypothetical protein